MPGEQVSRINLTLLDLRLLHVARNRLTRICRAFISIVDRVLPIVFCERDQAEIVIGRSISRRIINGPMEIETRTEIVAGLVLCRSLLGENLGSQLRNRRIVRIVGQGLFNLIVSLLVLTLGIQAMRAVLMGRGATAQEGGGKCRYRSSEGSIPPHTIKIYSHVKAKPSPNR